MDPQRRNVERILHTSYLTDLSRWHNRILPHTIQLERFCWVGRMGAHKFLRSSIRVSLNLWQRLDETTIFHSQLIENLLWLEPHLWIRRRDRWVVWGQILLTKRAIWPDFPEWSARLPWHDNEVALTYLWDKGLAVCRSGWVYMQSCAGSYTPRLHRQKVFLWNKNSSQSRGGGAGERG